MIQQVDSLYLSAFKRGVRTFVAAFIGVYGIPQILEWLGGSAPLDTSALRAAAVAGFASVVSLLWRAFIDPIPAPTLSDTSRPPGA